MATNRSSNFPEGLPRALRAICLTWITAWLLWQLFGPLLASYEPGWKGIWLGRLSLTLLSILLALVVCNSNRSAGWQWRDLLIVPLATALLVFQLSTMTLRIGPGAPLIGFSPWQSEALNAAQAREAQLLEALWQDALWFENTWNPVILPRGDSTGQSGPEPGLAELRNLTEVAIRLQGQGEQVALTLSHDNTQSDLPLLGAGTNPLTVLSETLSVLRELQAGAEVQSIQSQLGPGNDPDWFQCRINASHSRSNEAGLVALRARVFETPDRAAAHAALADCLYARGSDPGWVHEARASANRAFRLDPDSVWSRRLLANLSWTHELKAGEADFHWRELLRQHPHHASLALDRARMMMAAGLRDEAGTLREVSVQSAPGHPEGLYLAALEALAEDRDAEALTQLEPLSRRFPDRLEYHQAMYLAAARLGPEPLSRLLNDGPEGPWSESGGQLSDEAAEGLALQIWAHAKAGRSDEAERLRTRFFDAAPRGDSRSYAIAMIQDGFGNSQASERALLAAALARDPRLTRPVSGMLFSQSSTMRELKSVWQSELSVRLAEKEISNSP